MDSFYDAPRRAPLPTQIDKFLPAPVVPEVSIISGPKSSTNKYSSYNSWKAQQNKTENACVLTSNRENIVRGPQKFPEGQFPSPQNTSQFLKKQVRFESPVLQQRPSLTYEPLIRKTGTQDSGNAITSKPFKNCDISNPSQHNHPVLNGATFQQIYLSNIPNRNLDLSLIDLHKKPDVSNKKEVEIQCEARQMDLCKVDSKKNEDEGRNTPENKENMLPKTYRDFLNTQKKIYTDNGNPNDSVRDIFNYKRKQFAAENRTPPNFKKQFADENRTANFTKPSKIDCAVSSNPTKGDLQHTNPRFFMEKQETQLPFYEYNRQQPNFGNFHKHFVHSPKCDKDTQTSVACATPEEPKTTRNQEITCKTDSEPTNRDLLKIIAQQNEQLLILQKQVAMLLNRDEQNQPKQIEAAPHPCQRMNYLEKCATSTQNENFRQDANNTPKKQRGLSKFSIDLMTSFEVAIRPQTKQNFVNHEPKIQEITESESGMGDSGSAVDRCEKTLVDTSLHLQEPVKVREMCPSPEPSININMNDYDSSDDDEVSASEIGATFYRNLMGQVNDILRKAQAQTKGDFREGQNGANSVKNQTMDRVKEATLRHLRNIGVTIGPINEIDDELSVPIDAKNYTPSEVSFAVKQLLMKYLPDEQLAKITYKQAQTAPFNKARAPGVIPNRPEFSFATVEYMKKYNLISNNKDAKPKNMEQVPKTLNTQKPEGPKILDITALKMQPKLL